MKPLSLILAGLMLSGCSALTPQLVVKEVKVPVPIPCQIVAPERPVMSLDNTPVTEGNIFVIFKRALAEIQERKGYEIKLEGAITACNK
jgi:hypothetical protein